MKTKIPLLLLSGFLLFLIRCSSELCNTGVGLLDSHCVYENSEEPHFTSLENKRDFFIVGTRGILLHSKNGINWFRKELPWDTEEADIGQLGFLTNRTLHAVTYGNNMLVVTGDWGYVFVSMDRGKTWERADRSALALADGPLSQPEVGKLPCHIQRHPIRQRLVHRGRPGYDHRPCAKPVWPVGVLRLQPTSV